MNKNNLSLFSFLFSVIFINSVSLFCANLTPSGISVLDNMGTKRTNFSNTEPIVMWQKVYNSNTSSSKIYFTFYILNPSGSICFQHTGNAAPGTQGYSETQISGINISQFYSVPGEYTFRGKAELDSETVTQEIKFTVSSPNITLIYPPYGARNLSDNPLTFRWVSSGASMYRIIVADNAGMNNPAHSYTNNGENSYTYPDNPTLPREKLTPGEVYYWKVEGLDSVGNVISQSLVYNFSIKSESSNQSRNVKISALSLTAPVMSQKEPVNFKVSVINEGNTSENNINIKLSLGGVEANDSPKQIAIINSGQSHEIPFTAFMPENQEQALAVACIDIFDDNISDNCKTLLVNTASYNRQKKKLNYDEMIEILKKRLGIGNIEDLKDYDLISIVCPSCGEGELSDLISGLVSGESQVSGVLVEGDEGTTKKITNNFSKEEFNLTDLNMKIEFFTELSGFTSVFENKDSYTLVIKDRKEWKNIWQKMFADKDLPEVDFSKNMVVLIVSSPKDNADFIRLMGIRKSGEESVIDYYIVENPQEAMESAYILKSIERIEGSIKFNKINRNKR